jgi:hypothetical protein
VLQIFLHHKVVFLRDVVTTVCEKDASALAHAVRLNDKCHGKLPHQWKRDSLGVLVLNNFTIGALVGDRAGYVASLLQALFMCYLLLNLGLQVVAELTGIHRPAPCAREEFELVREHFMHTFEIPC